MEGGALSMDKVYIYDNTAGGMRSIEGYQYMQSGQGGGIYKRNRIRPDRMLFRP